MKKAQVDAQVNARKLAVTNCDMMVGMPSPMGCKGDQKCISDLKERTQIKSRSENSNN